MKKIIGYGLLTILALVILAGGYIGHTLWRHGVFEEEVFETEAPDLPNLVGEKKVLVFSKTNGFRHVDAIPAANNFFRSLAVEKNWAIYLTENAATFSADILDEFDLIVWNNVSGNNFLPDQREAFKTYMEEGGKLLAIHASGGDPHYDWVWHPAELIRAQFSGHPMAPQFQNGRIIIEDKTHPAVEHLPDEWKIEDEWYSFKETPRPRVNVLARLDENSYGAEDLVSGDLRMGDDHPVIWHHQVGKGTVFYSAIGHLAERYKDPEYRTLLTEASIWLMEQ